jgi:hypothetical protein
LQEASLKPAGVGPCGEHGAQGAALVVGEGHLDFWERGMNRANAHGKGIIRKKGGVVEIVYFYSNTSARAVSFEEPPEGYYLLTLQRVR